MLEVGRVGKAHALKGEVVVTLVSNRPERLDPGSVLQSDGGELTVLASRPFEGRWLVFFEGIESRSAAERLRGVVLRAEPLDEPDELWVHELVGAEVFTTDGLARGRVTAVQANPASDLLVLEGGALVPLTFVRSSEGGRIEVEAPDGLFDL